MKYVVGVGFRPKKHELVGYYLYNKNQGKTELVDEAISEVDIYSFDPWNLPIKSKIKSKDREWYFFSPIKNKFASGNRQNRTAISGKWKLTGKSVDVKNQFGKKIGHKRVLVFLDGINNKSDWVIHEFHCELLPEHLRSHVICKLKYKGDGINITSSEASVVNQSPQGNSGFYNAYPEFDMPEFDLVGQQFSNNLLNQSPQGNSGFYNAYPEFNMPEFDLDDHQFSNNLLNQQPLDEENIDFLLEEYSQQQEYRSVCIPKKPVAGFFTDDSSNSDDTDYAIGSDNSSGTDTTPIDDDIPSLNTINPLHTYEAQEQPKLHLQLINTQESDSIKKTPSTKWIALEEISQRNSQWIYLKNMIIGFLLFISIIRWIIYF